MATPSPQPLFSLGRIVATPGALETMRRKGIDPDDLLHRHVSGDWGDACEEDAAANNRAVALGGTIYSFYGPAGDPARIYIITEANRSCTTMLRADEY